MFAKVYDTVLAEHDPVALITSHLDYAQWGLAVESAMRREVPVVHVQTTGTLKAYTLFPESRRGDLTFRGELTRQIGEYFSRDVWPHRERLHPAAERTVWRNKSNLGRPTWWRRGEFSPMELRTSEERAAVRRHTMHRLGLDPANPVVGVFNHAISDALGTNVEVFDDLAGWFAETVDFAARRDDVNWICFDHPAQHLYDEAGFFDRVAERKASCRHMRFVKAPAVGKNLRWSLVDLGVTVRGSISSELPAYGVPALQAGWSEWSDLGFTAVAQDVDDYWRLLRDSLAALRSGRRLLSDEQVEKARLWMWFYRSANDVPSLLLQPWDLGDGDALFTALRTAMQEVESDGDPVFDAVRRMWRRREPCLTRFDLAAAHDVVADHDGTADAPGSWLGTTFDAPVQALSIPGTLSGGRNPALQVVDGCVRGRDALARFFRPQGLVGAKVRLNQDTDGPIRVTATLSVDSASRAWWDRWASAGGREAAAGWPRLVRVRSQGRDRATTLLRFEPGADRDDVSFVIDPDELDPCGLFIFELTDFDTVMPDWAVSELAPQPVVGVVLHDIVFAAENNSRPVPGSRRDTVVPIANGLFLGRPHADGTSPTWRLRPVPRPEALPEGPPPASRSRWLRASRLLGARRQRSTERDPPATPDAILGTLTDDSIRVDAVSVETGEERPLSVSRAHDAVELSVDAPLREPILVRFRAECGGGAGGSPEVVWHLVG